MKALFISLLSICLSLALVGCAGQSGDTSTTGSQRSSEANADKIASNAEAPDNRGPVPGQETNKGPNPSAAENPRLGSVRPTGGNQPAETNADIEALLSRSTRPAPDNSTFAVAMANVVVERRTFLKHPVLVTVQRVNDGGRSTTKVVTRDGRTIDLPENAIKNLSVASAAAIVEAAGLQTPESQLTDRKPGAANRN